MVPTAAPLHLQPTYNRKGGYEGGGGWGEHWGAVMWRRGRGGEKGQEEEGGGKGNVPLALNTLSYGSVGKCGGSHMSGQCSLP